MNLTAPLSFIAVLALVGCASTPGISQEEVDWQQARQTHTAAGYKAFLNTHSDSEHREDAMQAAKAIHQFELEANRIREAWPKLAKGMTVDQVNKLLGPIDEVSLQHFTESMDLAREYGLTESTNTLMNQSPAGMYKLVFNTEGKLTEWSWE